MYGLCLDVQGLNSLTLHGKPISELWSVTCHMGSQCYLPLDSRERAAPKLQVDRLVLNLPVSQGWKAELIVPQPSMSVLDLLTPEG